MPFYRFKGLTVHVKLSGRRKAPAPCVADVRSNTRELTACGAFSAFLCDWKLSDGKTCDAPLCDAHAHQVAKNRHHCPRHHSEHTHQAPQRSLFSGLVGKP